MMTANVLKWRKASPTGLKPEAASAGLAQPCQSKPPWRTICLSGHGPRGAQGNQNLRTAAVLWPIPCGPLHLCAKSGISFPLYWCLSFKDRTEHLT